MTVWQVLFLSDVCTSHKCFKKEEGQSVRAFLVCVTTVHNLPPSVQHVHQVEGNNLEQK